MVDWLDLSQRTPEPWRLPLRCKHLEMDLGSRALNDEDEHLLPPPDFKVIVIGLAASYGHRSMEGVA